MANLKEIKSRIKSIESIHQITKAMKMVASSRINKAESLYRARAPYTEQLNKIMANIQGQGEFSHPLIEERETINNVGILVITGDKGLCGAYNNSIIRISDRLKRKFELDGIKVINYLIGSKVCKYFDRRGLPSALSERSWTPDDEFSERIFARLSSDFMSGVFDALYVVGAEPKSRTSYSISEWRFLPFESSEEYLSEGDFVFEPSAEKAINLIVPLILKQKLATALIAARYAEYSARIIAMTNATDNAEKLVEELRLNYFRARQAAITTEILEVSSAAVQMEKQ